MRGAKERARAEARSRRAAAQATLGVEAASAFARHFFAALTLAPGAVIAAYSPISSEADPMAILKEAHARGFACALPSVAEKNAPLVFRRWAPGDPLADGPHGTREPRGLAPLVEPDVLVVPLLAFDKVGRRLGYGGGYYDRTLQAMRAAGQSVIAVGLAFSAQEAEELPEDGDDQRLDWIVTELGARTFGRPR